MLILIPCKRSKDDGTLRVSSRSKRIPRIDLTILTLADGISNCYVRQEPFLGHPWSTQLEPNRFSLRACWRCLWVPTMSESNLLRWRWRCWRPRWAPSLRPCCSRRTCVKAAWISSHVWPCSPLTFWGPSGKDFEKIWARETQNGEISRPLSRSCTSCACDISWLVVAKGPTKVSVELFRSIGHGPRGTALRHT